MSRSIPAILAVAALVVAGCGSSSKSSSSSSSSSSAPASSGSEVAIDIKNFAFAPANATVHVGQTIKWTNQDSVDHNVVGGALKSDNFGKGGTYTFKATKPGTISYVCTIHPQMKATLTVVQ